LSDELPHTKEHEMTEQTNTDDRPASSAAPLGDAAAAAAAPRADPEPLYQPEGDWIDDAEELPPRPRRRLLTPVPLALLAALAIACGFIGGVLVEKGQGGSSGPGGAGSGLASRFAALSTRSGAGSATGSGSTSGSGSASPSATGAAQGRLGAGSGGGTSASAATVGQVAYVSKGTLYVTTLEGNTVKVKAAAGATVTKSVETKADGIHPGETVVVTGAAGADGTITAQSIRAGSTSGGLSGAAGLFGGAGSRSGATSGSGSAGSSGAASGGSGASGGGEQALFGKG
jgi:hypothetical protein